MKEMQAVLSASGDVAGAAAQGASSFTLRRDPHGHLVLIDAQGMEHAGVVPVRSFPIDAPLEGISLVGSDGHERAWVAHLSALAPDQAALISEELAQRDFMPVISRLVAVSTFATPSTWTVLTDRGPTELILKAEEDIRRLRDGGLLVTDSHGVVFRVLDVKMLDKHSRKLLDRFL